MKINEILTEGGTGSLTSGVERAMPSTISLPQLPNQDAYLQYRMGLAMAAARSGIDGFSDKSSFGENMVVVGYTDADQETVGLALGLMGKEYGEGAKLISTKPSQEALDVNPVSPSRSVGPIQLKSKK